MWTARSTGQPARLSWKSAKAWAAAAPATAKITKGYHLPAQWVIHTVGPIWGGGSEGEPALLARCYQRCLAIASQHHVKTIAFPAISAGAYGFPMGLAAEVAVKETTSYLEEDSSIEQVIFVCFNDSAHKSYRSTVERTWRDC